MAKNPGKRYGTTNSPHHAKPPAKAKVGAANYGQGRASKRGPIKTGGKS